MTIGGVQEIAVRSAADALDAGSAPARSPIQPKVNRLIGGPTRILFERVVEGELAQTEFPTLVEEIRHVLGNVGQVSQLGPSFTWTSTSGARRGDMEVAVTVRAGRTRILVQESLTNLMGGIFGGIGGGMGGGGSGILSGVVASIGTPEAIALIIPLWLAATYGVARTAYYYSSRARTRELEQLADRLAAVTRELVPPPPLLGPGRKLLP